MNLSKPLTLLLLLSPSLHASSQVSGNVAGEYYLTGVRETASGFRLNQDNSFDFFFSQGAADRMGKGTWRKEGDFVHLSGQHWPGNDFKLLRETEVPSDSLFIQVNAPDPMYYPFTRCYLQRGGQYEDKQLRSDGRVYFANKHADTLFIQFELCPERATPFALKDLKGNLLEFSIEPWIMEVFIPSLTLRIEGNKLVGAHPLLKGEEFEYEKD
ncbi:hypothetical protein KJS94_03435 [Flavihumibacter rivuli]|uniref:hypothetical protein n=1 Tax=Flavihumibacter rivuli TaxID=2838156 RepID=UPI001BDF49C2|nr:hypothetical protein [Flavihumibacter rivuli]ULQ57251.1 hypothetical protein KJS94_03435 [Flavihumibacter rivuli]